MVSARSVAGLLATVPASILVSAKGFDYDSLSLREVGARNTLDWRIWLEQDGEPISFWHDIPLYPNENDTSIINYYIEIPRWTDGKIETQRNEPLNPIFHDDKDGKVRFVYNVWPHKTYPFNYGSIPQTWEDPNHDHDITGFPGDNDPVDVFDISSLPPGRTGEVKQAKIIGGLAMIDDETTDWKIIVIDLKDPLANVVDTVTDLDKYRPGLRESFYDWFIYYKVAKGDGTNTIVGDDYRNATVARQIISESHGYWQNLIKGKVDGKKIARNQTSNPRWCSTYIESDKATEAFDLPKKSDIKPAAERPAEYDQWYYLDDNFEVIELPGRKN